MIKNYIHRRQQVGSSEGTWRQVLGAGHTVGGGQGWAGLTSVGLCKTLPVRLTLFSSPVLLLYYYYYLI